MTRRRFIFNAATGLMVPFAGRIIRAAGPIPQTPARGSSAGGGTWTPPASQIFFVESSSIAQSDNTAVNTWTDEGSGATSLTALGNAPKFHTPIKNGFGAVRWTSSPQTGMSGSLSASHSALTFCALVNFANVTAQNSIFDASGSGGNGLDVFSSKIRLMKTGLAVIGSSNTSISTGVWYAIVATYDSVSGAWAIYINSATADNSTTNVQSFNGSLTTRIGLTSGSSAPLQGDTLELRKGNAVWANSDISGWISYVTTRYALP